MGNAKSKSSSNKNDVECNEEVINASNCTSSNLQSQPPTKINNQNMSSGLVKPKKYDWKDSNLAMFGSDNDKKVKKESANTEDAWAPVGKVSGNEIFVWRIEKFKVKPWPKEDYGKFYSGDSYIILNVYKDPEGDELLYDAHFWIGKRSTQDEYGTAAYKTVELDTFLDDKAIQHREVQDFESSLFKSYFPVITILKGGCASGFRHVEPEKYVPRLIHFFSIDAKHVQLNEVTFSKNSLKSGDVFILDNGLTAYQWNGKLANKDERIKAAQMLQQLESERNGKCKTEVFDESSISESHRFYGQLPDKAVKEKKAEETSTFRKSLFRLSDNSGNMTFTLVSEGTTPKSVIKEDDVYVIDTGKKVFVYVGATASKEEKLNAMTYAHNYLKNTTHPYVPVTIVSANQKCKELAENFD